MKTVFWTTTGKKNGFYQIEMWTKPDQSDVTPFKSITMHAEKLRNKVASIIGTQAFKMNYVQTKWSVKK